ncbi:MAG: hypothetical protein H6600_06845 [Flavobacteriales bacterium]|nr:hypothetical protein [Flavobacteriales bacterium]MCB9198157.1 hypothetical protein [Flavobacteriales bacterium]
MKKLYFLLFLGLFSVASFAQTENDNCYEQYRKVFENRGAFEVEDGVHDNVVLSIKTKTEVECILVSVTVKNKEIVEIVVYYEDETKDILKYDFKDAVAWTIFNGMSRTRITKQEEQITIFFTDKVKPKKKEYKKAPLPKFDLND